MSAKFVFSVLANVEDGEDAPFDVLRVLPVFSHLETALATIPDDPGLSDVRLEEVQRSFLRSDAVFLGKSNATGQRFWVLRHYFDTSLPQSASQSVE